jgi:hypothetical protein
MKGRTNAYAKVNTESMSDSSSHLVVRIQNYCCIIMHKLNENCMSWHIVRRPIGFVRSPLEVIQSYDCTDIKERPLRLYNSPNVVSKEIGLNLLNKSKKRPSSETQYCRVIR